MIDHEEAELRRTVGINVRVGRVLRDVSQQQLAERAGVTRNFVSAVERGAQGLDAYRLRRIAQALDVPLAALLESRPTDRPHTTTEEM